MTKRSHLGEYDKPREVIAACCSESAYAVDKLLDPLFCKGVLTEPIENRVPIGTIASIIYPLRNLHQFVSANRLDIEIL